MTRRVCIKYLTCNRFVFTYYILVCLWYGITTYNNVRGWRRIFWYIYCWEILRFVSFSFLFLPNWLVFFFLVGWSYKGIRGGRKKTRIPSNSFFSWRQEAFLFRHALISLPVRSLIGNYYFWIYLFLIPKIH